MFQRGDIVRLVENPAIRWEVLSWQAVAGTLQLICVWCNTVVECWALDDEVVLVREAITEGAASEL